MKNNISEQDLIQSEQKYITLVENFPNGAVGLFDQDLRYTAVGGELVNAVGVDPKDRIGNRITDIYPDEVVEEVEPYFRTTLEGEQTSFETEFHNRKLFAQTLPIKNDEGKVVSGMLVVQDVTEPWKAQQALRESEQKYRTLFEKMDEGLALIKMVFDTDNKPINFHVLEVNSSYQKHTGLEEDVEGKKAKEVLPNLQEDIFIELGNVSLTGKPFQDEFYIDEIDRWLDLSAFRIGEPKERKVAVLFTDITARKEKEHANAYLKAIVDSSDDAIISADLDGIITSWNNAAERIFGYTAEEAIGQPITIIIPDERLDEETRFIDQIKRGEGIHNLETIRQRKDGIRLDVSLTLSPIINAEGTIVGISAITRDITARKESEEERKQLLQKVKSERKRLSKIFQNAPSFMCILRGPDYVLERANDLYMKLIGEDREVVGKPIREVLPEVEGQGFFERLDKVYKNGEPSVLTEIPINLNRQQDSGQDLETRYIDLVCQPLRDSAGTINGVFVQGIDLTERYHAKEQLKELNNTLEERVEERTKSLVSYQKQLRSLVAELSSAEEQERQRLASDLHDNLGQILAVSKMKIAQVQKDQVPDSEAKDLMELEELIQDALTYTRELTSDLKPPASLDEGDLKAHIKWVAEKMKKHDLEVTIEDDERPKPLSKEVRMTLLQCVRELLFNVVKHASVKEAVVIIKRHKEIAQITVKDGGEGFKQKHEETTPDNDGGFGLFSIRERIDMLGGRMDLDSEPGKGTKVNLYVPLEDKDQISSEVSHREEESEMIEILLVDDPHMMREGLRSIIEKENDMTVVGETDDGEKAVEMVSNLSPDIVLMEINLPKVSGIEITKRILAEDSGIRIISLSDVDDEETIHDMRKAGASSFIKKSEAFKSLTSSIRAEASVQK